MLAGDERAHLRLGIGARPDLDLGQALLDGLDQRLGHVAHGDHRGDGHAALAGGAVAGADGRVGGHVDVGVGQHDHVVLGAAQRLDALAVLRAGLVDVARDGRRADEGDGRDVRVLEEAIDGHLVALDDVEDAVGHAGLVEQLGQVDRGRGILLGRLEDERVAAGDGVGEHPHRHHGREVEGRDADHHAQRLADLVDVDAGRDLLAEAALHQMRDAGRELQVLDAAGDLAQGVGGDLAVLSGQEAPPARAGARRPGSGCGT